MSDLYEFYQSQCVCDFSPEDIEHNDGEWGLLCECGAYGRWLNHGAITEEQLHKDLMSKIRIRPEAFEQVSGQGDGHAKGVSTLTGLSDELEPGAPAHDRHFSPRPETADLRKTLARAADYIMEQPIYEDTRVERREAILQEIDKVLSAGWSSEWMGS